MLATLHELGVASSFSWRWESTTTPAPKRCSAMAKYCTLWPERPFDTLDEASVWVHRFVACDHNEHRHSAVNFVTPSQRHSVRTAHLLTARAELYAKSHQQSLTRWARHAGDWRLANDVYLYAEPTSLKMAA